MRICTPHTRRRLVACFSGIMVANRVVSGPSPIWATNDNTFEQNDLLSHSGSRPVILVQVNTFVKLSIIRALLYLVEMHRSASS